MEGTVTCNRSIKSKQGLLATTEQHSEPGFLDELSRSN